MTDRKHSFSGTVVRNAEKPATGTSAVARPARLDPRAAARDLPREVGGYQGLEPTRFGDWEHKGRCTDF